jgi:hypothetical protein
VSLFAWSHNEVLQRKRIKICVASNYRKIVSLLISAVEELEKVAGKTVYLSRVYIARMKAKEKYKSLAELFLNPNIS